MTERANAIAALDRLAEHDGSDAAMVGTFMAHLEALNDRLAQHAAAAGKVLEDGKRDLMRAGWVTWHDVAPKVPARPGKSGLVLRIVLDDDSGFSLTEAGTQRALAVYVVEDPQEVPGIAALGPDPLAPGFTQGDFHAVLAGAGRSQLKGVLRDQKRLAGIGNAYSDEILFVAKLSPFKPADGLDDEETARLFDAMVAVLTEAVAVAAGRPLTDLKDTKRAHMRVHGRTGEPCAVCGKPIAEISYSSSSMQYCPGCQTGGKPLADRRMSRLLK